jgi:RecA-family ATPase
LLPYQGIAFIGGQSGAGKTFLACDLAVALGSETSFFGHAVKERIGVAMIAAEGAEQIGNRLHAAAHARGVRMADLPIAWRGDVPLLKTPATSTKRPTNC